VDEFVTLNKALPPVAIFADLAEANSCNGLAKKVSYALDSSQADSNNDGEALVTVEFYNTTDTPAAGCDSAQLDNLPSVLSGKTIVFRAAQRDASVDWGVEINGDKGTLERDYLPSFGTL
jgi:hypothetical protein